jgi:hypothetical protein
MIIFFALEMDYTIFGKQKCDKLNMCQFTNMETGMKF